MNGYLETWRFTRVRLAPSWEDLTDAQLAWKSPEGEGPIGDILAHIAGCEHFLGKRLLGEDPRATERDTKLDDSARAVFLNEDPFPWTPAEMSSAGLKQMLDETAASTERALSEGIAKNHDSDQDSPLGATIKGAGAAQRMAQHAGYHTGQIWMIRRHPEFPKA